MDNDSFLPSPKVAITAGIIILILLAVTPGIYFYQKYQTSQKQLKTAAPAVTDEYKTIMEKLGKLVDLPKDEEPTVATVTDAEKVKGQPFFAKAKNGFKVLIFNRARKAILYDPEKNKVIEMSSLLFPTPSSIPQSPAINISSDPTPASASVTTINSVPQLKTVLYNGTDTGGLASKLQKTTIFQTLNLAVINTDFAKKRTYDKTLVVDLTGKHTEEIKIIASLLYAHAGPLPDGETKPSDADILIIIGADKK